MPDTNDKTNQTSQPASENKHSSNSNVKKSESALYEMIQDDIIKSRMEKYGKDYQELVKRVPDRTERLKYSKQMVVREETSDQMKAAIWSMHEALVRRHREAQSDAPPPYEEHNSRR